MLFLELAKVFEQIEGTTKRLEMFEILSNFLNKIPKIEIDETVYFCQEQIAPPFKGIEFNMAEKMVEKAIVKASSRSLEEIKHLHKKLGDLGLVAEQVLVKKQRILTGSKKLNIIEIYSQLLKIAQVGGAGSVERKISMLTGLFAHLSSIEARYVVRFVLGRMRLGIGDPTIMDSLSKAISGDRMKLRPEIERAYNLCSDLALVASTLFEKGVKGLKRFKVQVGSPIRMALCERLPNAKDIIKKIGKCSVETKYDGFRLQIHSKGNKIEIFSRNQEIMTHMFPDIIKALKKQVKAKSFIIEGEAVGYNEEADELLPFQVTITRKRKHHIEEKVQKIPMVLFSFDLLYLNGKELINKPYIERTKILRKIIRKGFIIRSAERIITSDAKKLDDFFEANISRGTEGIIAKRLDSGYQAGARNFNWIKLKRSYKSELKDTIDVVLVGYFRGKGMRAKFGIGALLGAVYDKKKDEFKTIARIGSGLTEQKWVEIRKLLDKIKLSKKPLRVDSLIKADVWVNPEYVFTVKADEITKSPMHTAGKKKNEPGFALRFPRIQGWIRDKKKEDATTIKEIERLFKMQQHVSTSFKKIRIKKIKNKTKK
jgi:DNA ligase-1